MNEEYVDVFAQAYDQHWSPYPTRMGRELVRWHAEVAPDADRRVLDIGCGTGLASSAFQQAGYHVTGLDVSAAMLARARDRLGEEAVLVHGDARELVVDEPVPLAISTYDIPNHLGDLASIEAYLRRAYAAVTPGGHLVFDVATRLGLQGINSVQVRETDDSILVFRGALNDEAGYGFYRISGVVRGEDGRYDRFATTITNTVVPFEQLRGVLSDVGWRLVHVAGTQDVSTPLQGEIEAQPRVVFVAEHP